MNEAEPTAEGHAAAAELTALRAASPPQPPDGARAADAQPTAKPKPPTAMQVESALKDNLQLLRDRADALLKHTANTDQYLVDVVRRHSANPAIGGGRGKILTMLRCPASHAGDTRDEHCSYQFEPRRGQESGVPWSHQNAQSSCANSPTT